MAPMLSGRIDIQYRRVQCTPPSNLQVNIDQNSGTGGFLKMSVSVSPHQLQFFFQSCRMHIVVYAYFRLVLGRLLVQQGCFFAVHGLQLLCMTRLQMLVNAAFLSVCWLFQGLANQGLFSKDVLACCLVQGVLVAPVQSPCSKCRSSMHIYLQFRLHPSFIRSARYV